MRKQYVIISIIIVSWLICVFILSDLCVELIVEPNVTIEYGDEYCVKSDAYLVDKLFGKKLRKLDVNLMSDVDVNKLGSYDVTYRAEWGIWAGTANQKVNVVDTKKPEIILVEDDTYYTLPNHSYEEQGFTAIDNYDGDITDKVVRIEQNDIVRYSVVDSAGNHTEVVRKIVYNDLESPVITLKGSDVMMLKTGEVYIEPGFVAIDNADGDITSNVVTESNLDTNKNGKYDVAYSVSDTWGNETKVVRTVYVTSGKSELTEEMLGVPDTKIIYLTFDDGPGPYTAELLDILDKYNVKATFFVTNQYPSYRSLIAEEYNRGHTVAIHTYSHDYSDIYSSEKHYFEDLYKMQQIIMDETGDLTRLIRFPGGSSNTVSKNYKKGIMTSLSRSLSDKNFVYFDWNVSSGDAGETTDTKDVVENVINGCQQFDKSVVLQHDIKAFSVNAVEDIIKWGQANGYTFLPLRVDSFNAHHGINN